MNSDSSVPREVRETAQTLIEIAAGVMQTDAASLWWHDEQQAYLVARYPRNKMPGVMPFETMPEVARSILAAETQLYVRSDADGPTRKWMEDADIEVSLRLPVATEEFPYHFLGLSWATTSHPHADTLVPTARRLAEQIARALGRLTAQHRRIESALELADNVAQALVVAKASLHLERRTDAEQAIERALAETSRIMGRLMREDRTGDLTRVYPSDVLGPGRQ